MAASYMDDASELSNYELDVLATVYPEIIDKSQADRINMRLEHLFDNGY